MLEIQFDMEDITVCSLAHQSHPLYNELILENIFKFLSVPELKSMRTVCKLYNEIARPFLQDKSIVKLDENVHQKGLSLNSFLEDFISLPPEKVLFHNYKLNLWNMDYQSSRITVFWQMFGSSMRSLEISWGRFSGIRDIKDILFNWTPNMKHLVLRDCSFFADKNPKSPASTPYVIQPPGETDVGVKVNPNLTCLEFYGAEPQNLPPIQWEEIFIAYPNIKQLLLFNLSPTDHLLIFEAIQKLRRRHPHCIRLEKLNVFNGDYANGEVPDSVFSALMSLKFQLTSLNLDIGAICNEYQVSKFFEQHSKTIRKLSIYRGPLGTPMCHFPFEIVFPQLEWLEMTETVADKFNFIKYTPKLKSLSLCEPPEVEPPFLPTDMMFKTDYDFPQHTLPLHLTNLRIDYDCSYGDVRKLAHWFPNVKTVKIYLDNESLRTICGEWPNLEELEIYGDRVNDEGITGMKVKRENGEEIIIRNPLCIQSLKRLRTFIMKNYGMSTTISDLSVEHGLLRIKTLTYVELCSRNITENGWRTLYNLPYLTTLIPKDGRWQSNCDAFRKGQPRNFGLCS